MFIDLNAPDNSMCEEHRRLRNLWQNVVIQTAKQACESSQDAYNIYLWTNSASSRRVCEMAELDHDMIKKCFFRLQSDPDFRQRLRDELTSYKSRNTRRLSKESNLIQQELFI